MIKTSLLTTLLVFTLFFQACSKQKEQDETQSANSMVATNEYVLTALDKKQYVVKKEADGFKLQGADGKVVIFDIFATWCPPCQAGATHLTSLSKKYPKDLIVIGVTIEDNVDNAKLEIFRKEHNAQYTLVNSSENRRFVNAIASSLKLGERFPIPIVAMYKDGKIINHYVGAVEEEFIQSDIKKALGK
jgi:thiol-disulfide isomerase/thioredoxin